MTFRARFWPTVFSIIGLILLLLLGTWQLNRFVDARAFEKQRDATMDLPVASVQSPGELADGELDFRRVEVAGTWAEQHLFAIKHRIYEGTPGLWIVHPLTISNDGESGVLLVNRGWISVEEGIENARQLLADSGGQTARVSGLIHRLDDVVVDDGFHDRLAGEPRPTGVVELESYDTTAMHRIVGDGSIDRPIVLTQTPDGDDDEPPLASTDHITEPYLTAETHFGYMLTWYLLALALIAIWIAHGLGLLESRSYDHSPDETSRS